MSEGLHNVENATHIQLTGRKVGWGRKAGVAVSDPRIIARFFANVNKTDTCWLWTGSRTGGSAKGRYGQFSLGLQQKLYAHRFSYLLHCGDIPAGLHVLHACDVRLCVNPAHLSLGTHLDNMRDAAEKGTLHVGRPSGRKVSDAQVEEMVALRAAGALLADIAESYGVTKTFVSLVVRGLRRRAA